MIGGGKFENGAITAAFGYLYNNMPHEMGDPDAAPICHEGCYMPGVTAASALENEVVGGLALSVIPVGAAFEAASVAVRTWRAVSAAKDAGIVAKDGTVLTGLTKHGVDRVIGDGAKRAGTKPDAILDAVRNPTKIKEGVDNLGRPFKVYTGENARVVVNPETGRIISTNPLSREGAHLP